MSESGVGLAVERTPGAGHVQYVKSKPGDNESDSQLIRRFAEGRDERAFAELVKRRGPLVAGVCARMMRNREDAEDAFQAVFLVLARRAAAVRRCPSLAGWLHNAAVRVCLNERRGRARRRRLLHEAGTLARKGVYTGPSETLKRVIDEELAALPERLREALILCDLEGRTQSEAARMLAVPAGTVSSRLARARQAMRKRLARHGLPLAVGAVTQAFAVCGQAAPAVSAELVHVTVRNAHIFVAGTAAAKATLGAKISSLAERVLHAMIVSRWKNAAFAFVLLAATLFGGVAAPTVLSQFNSTAAAATIVYDDFEDGSVTDGSPAAWRPAMYLSAVSLYSVVAGDLHVSTPPGVHVGGVGVPVTLGDTSIRAVVRINGVGDQNVGIVARANDQNGQAHAAEIEADGDVFIGINQVYTRTTTNLQPTQEDVVLQLDVIGNSVQVWAWRAGEPKPSAPLLTGSDVDSVIPCGFPGVYSGQSIPPQPAPSTAIVRSIQISDTTIQDADFDGDGHVDGNDFILWQRGVGSTGAAATLATGDANGDNVVDDDDLALWKHNFGNGGGVSAIPEPAAAGLAVASVGLLALVWRRKRCRFA